MGLVGGSFLAFPFLIHQTGVNPKLEYFHNAFDSQNIDRREKFSTSSLSRRKDPKAVSLCLGKLHTFPRSDMAEDRSDYHKP